jgi:hypothetical protein
MQRPLFFVCVIVSFSSAYDSNWLLSKSLETDAENCCWTLFPAVGSESRWKRLIAASLSRQLLGLLSRRHLLALRGGRIVPTIQLTLLSLECGDEVRRITKASKSPGVRIATLCDVDERRFPEALAKLGKVTQNKRATETDLRRVLDDKEIDAVTIATPDHRHALAAIWACQAGKDVYVCFAIASAEQRSPP